MLHQLTVVTADGAVEMSREQLDPLRADTHRMGLRTNGQNANQWIVTTSGGDVVAAISVEAGGGRPAVGLPMGTPRLFVAFPLNGTQSLCIPLVLNSELFVPREERDGVYLGVGMNDANKKNMELFVVGCRRIVELVSLAAEQRWLNAPALTHLQPLESTPWADKNWLRSQIRSVLIQGFRTAPILQTLSGKLLSPNSAWVPVGDGPASSLDVWEASERLVAAADRLPQREDQEAWASGVQSWTAFLQTGEGKLAEVWTVERLADHLAGLRNMVRIADALLPESSTLSWVNGVHAVICKAGRLESFNLKPLVPNQRGVLTTLGKLYKDGGIDSELKDIGDLVGVPVRGELVDPGIDTSTVLESLSVRTEEQVTTQLLDLIRQRARQNKFDEVTQNASVRLFAWVLKRGKIEKLEGFPVLTIPDPGGKQETLFLQANKRPAERPLAPCAIWPEAARPYSELFPEIVILGQRYATACDTAASWEALAEAGFVHVVPLYEAESMVEGFFPDEPLSEAEQKARSETTQQRTEISWLSGGDRSIIDRARHSRVRAVKLLRFCIDYILPADPRAFDVQTVRCDNGSEHSYYRANWLGPFRTRRWVPVEANVSVAPSAESFAKLLDGEQDLLKRLAEERVSKLLEILGVSPADLLLRSVGRNDSERMSLIQSLAVITSAAGNDAGKVQALAGAIQNDPDVIDIVEERQARMERVQRNQELGYLVERLFVEVFQGSGLTVHRTGTGHDFRVEAPAGEEEDAGRVEVSGAVGSILFEVKATTGDSVTMSYSRYGMPSLAKVVTSCALSAPATAI